MGNDTKGVKSFGGRWRERGRAENWESRTCKELADFVLRQHKKEGGRWISFPSTLMRKEQHQSRQRAYDDSLPLTRTPCLPQVRRSNNNNYPIREQRTAVLCTKTREQSTPNKSRKHRNLELKQLRRDISTAGAVSAHRHFMAHLGGRGFGRWAWRHAKGAERT